MTATIWSKFFWADWLSDANLRRCSPAARGLWMDMLCVAAQHEPIGYLCVNGESLNACDMARIAGVDEAQVTSLMAELARNGVCSRDRRGRLYSRRMVRDAQKRVLTQKNGAKGGNPSLSKQKGIPPPDKGEVKPPVNPRVQEPESKSQAAVGAPLLRACQAMGIDLETLRRKPAWMMFGDFFVELCRQGCDPERDIWPTIARVRARSGVMPSSPAYFKAAILEARDLHAGGGAVVSARASPRENAERMEAFARDGVWSSKWGPKPEGRDRASGIGDQRNS